MVVCLSAVFFNLLPPPAELVSEVSVSPAHTVSETCINAGAVRMRAHRQRRREGLKCVTLDLRDAEIERLMGLGHLRQDDRKDKNAVLLALSQFLDGSALGGAHR